jgi:hypothetical protein
MRDRIASPISPNDRSVFPTASSWPPSNHPEQQMLSTDVIVAVTAGLRMGPSDSASRWHAEYVEHANTPRAQPITGLLTMDLLADEFDSEAD